MNQKKIDITMQMNRSENGAAVLATILGYYGKHVSLDDVRTECTVSRMNTTVRQLCAAAEKFGMTCRMFENIGIDEVRNLKQPAVLKWNRYQYVILCGYKNKRFYLGDTYRGNIVVSEEEFIRRFAGTAMIFSPESDFEPGGKKVSSVRMVWDRLKGHKDVCIRILLLTVLSAIAATAAIALSQMFVDDVLAGKRPDIKNILCLAMLALMIIRIIISAVNTLQILHISKRVSARSGSELYKKLLRLPMSFFESHYVGDILDRIEMSSTLDQSFMKMALPRFIDAAMSVIYACLLIYYKPLLAVICIAFEIIYLIVSKKIRTEIGLISGSLNNSVAAVNSMTLGMLNTIETIKTIGAEHQFYSAWSRTNKEVIQNQFRRKKLNAVGNLLSGTIEAVSTAALLLIGAVFIIEGEFTMGMLSSYQAIMIKMRSSLSSAMETAGNIESLSVNVQRVDDIMTRQEEERVEISGEPDKLAGSITVRNLSYRYNKYDRPAIENISFDIKPGEFVALVGASGCGKSTLLKTLSGLYRPEIGEILYDGKKRSEIADAVFHVSLALVNQEPVIFRDTVENNIKLKDECIENYEMILAAKDAQIHNRIASSKDQYQMIIAENGRNFSGGEVQRFELARALAQEPTILLLDEFTSALDAATEQYVFGALKDRKSVTCILAAHRFSTVMSCDRVIVIKDGHIVETGKPNELCASGGEFSKLVKSM